MRKIASFCCFFVLLLRVDPCQFHSQFVPPLFSFNFKTSLTPTFSSLTKPKISKLKQTSSLSETATAALSWSPFIDVILLAPAVVGYTGLLGKAWVAPGQKLRRWVSLLLLLLVRLLLLLLLLLLPLLLLLSVNSQQPEGQGICPDPERNKSIQLKIWRQLFYFLTEFNSKTFPEKLHCLTRNGEIENFWCQHMCDRPAEDLVGGGLRKWQRQRSVHVDPGLWSWIWSQNAGGG